MKAKKVTTRCIDITLNGNLMVRLIEHKGNQMDIGPDPMRATLGDQVVEVTQGEWRTVEILESEDCKK